MTGIALQIVVLLLLLVANGVFALSELAVASSRKARLQSRAEEGDGGAAAALALANDPGRFLSSVQIGITLIGVLTGAFGGASLGAALGDALATVPVVGPYGRPLGVGIVVALITYLSLIIGELVPKQLALSNPEGLAAIVARPMRALARLTSPLVSLLSASTALVLRLLGIKPSTDPGVTEEEITILIEQGAQAGVFQTAERDLVDRVFRLGDQRVAELMVPRPNLVWIDADDPPEVSLRKMAEAGYTHYPICRGGLDNVVGIVAVQELWARSVLDDGAVTIGHLLRPPLYLPESLTAFAALERLQAAGTWVALVLDEYGSVEGMLTLTDLTGDLVGDVRPAASNPRAVRRQDGSWLMDGVLPLDEFRAIFPVGDLPDEEDGYFHTLGGFVQTALGRLPAAGDVVEAAGLRFEVVDMDGNRVDKVLVATVPGADAPAETTDAE
jgi:putative hemolysin